MSKKLVLFLVPLAAACAVAHAQSSVTLYGKVNTTLEHQKFSGVGNNTGLHSNSSKIGFKGEEDLGDGWSTGFKMQQKIDSTTGASTGFQSETNLHLIGPFGEVKVGNYDSAVYTFTTDVTSLHEDDDGDSADMLYAYIVPTNRKIGYISPVFNGVTFEGGYSFKDDQEHKTPYDMMLSYSAGAWNIGGGYTHWGNSHAYTATVGYTIGPLTLASYVQRDKNGMRWTAHDLSHNKAANSVSTGDAPPEPILDLGRRYTARVAVRYILGQSEFHLNGGWADSYKNLSDSGAWQGTVAYNYNMTKSTKLYTYYTHINNKRNAIYGDAPHPGSSFSSFAVGIRYLF